MVIRLGRSDPRSLPEAYGRPLPDLARTSLRRARRAVRARAVAASPVHYEAGDMRLAYRWRWAVTCVVVLTALAWAGRAAVIWWFATTVSASPVLVVAFHVAVTVGVGSLLVGTTRVGRPSVDGRRVGARRRDADRL